MDIIIFFGHFIFLIFLMDFSNLFFCEIFNGFLFFILLNLTVVGTFLLLNKAKKSLVNSMATGQDDDPFLVEYMLLFRDENM